MVNPAPLTKGKGRQRKRAVLVSSFAAGMPAPEPTSAAAFRAARTGGGSKRATLKPDIEGCLSAPEREAASARWLTRLGMAIKEAGPARDITAGLPEAELLRKVRRQAPLPLLLTSPYTLQFAACTTISTRQRRKVELTKPCGAPSESIAILPSSSHQVAALPLIRRARTSK